MSYHGYAYPCRQNDDICMEAWKGFVRKKSIIFESIKFGPKNGPNSKFCRTESLKCIGIWLNCMQAREACSTHTSFKYSSFL